MYEMMEVPMIDVNFVVASRWRRGGMAIAVICVVLVWAQPAHAAHLEVSPDAPAWAHVGATVVLLMHIAGGTLGLVAGAAASAARKGGLTHRLAGRAFFVSMLVAYVIGTIVAPFLAEGQRPNFVAGILALYLLISGVAAARRRVFRAGLGEKAGLVIALLITAMGVLFAHQSADSATGTLDGAPPEAFVVFILGGSVAAAGEVNVLLRNTLSEVARRSRHLWRMCFSFFIASGSLFLGQPQVFPGWFNRSMLPTALALMPLLVMLFWVIAVRAGGPHRRAALARRPDARLRLVQRLIER
jgi:hypothetical protein